MSIIKAIENAYAQMKERNWDKIYWLVDIHGTCLESNYKSGEYKLINDDVIKTLKLIQSLPESRLIMWTSTYNQELYRLQEFFDFQDVCFDYLGENPNIKNTETGNFNNKFYFSIGLDDKFGFDPETDWKVIEKTLKNLIK